MHLVQFELSNGERRVGVVDNGLVREVQDARSVRDLALAAIEAGHSLEQQVQNLGLGISHDYAELLALRAPDRCRPRRRGARRCLIRIEPDA